MAFLILSVGVLAMASVQIQSLRGGQRGRHLSQATTIAESRLEQLQRISWNNIPVAVWTADIIVGNDVQSQATQSEQDYRISWRVTDINPGSTRAIDVRVRWTESTGANREVTLSSIRSNYEGL